MVSSSKKIALIMAVVGVLAVVMVGLTIATDDSSAATYDFIEDHIKYKDNGGDVTIVGYEDGVAAHLNIGIVVHDSYEYHVKVVGAQAFKGCTDIETITVSTEHLLRMDSYAFEGCTSLTTVTITNASYLQRIGEYAFKDCTSLTTVRYMESDSASSSNVNGYAFSGCTSLQTVYVYSATLDEYSFSECPVLEAVIRTDGAGHYDDTLDDYGVAYDTSLKQKLICFPARFNLEDYAVPDDVQRICGDAFPETEYLKTVSIGSSVTNIANDAFKYALSLTEITVYSNDNYKSDSYGVLYTKNGELIRYPAARVTDSLNVDKETREVLPYAFYKAAVKNVNMGSCSGITGINHHAFYQCEAMTQVSVSDSSNWVIYNNAFEGCTKLTMIIFGDGLSAIGDMAFYGCTSITEFKIGKDVATIGTSVFDGCTSLQTFSYSKPDSGNIDFGVDGGVLIGKADSVLKTIIKYPEGKMSDTYSMPDTITTIGDRAFINSTYLLSIKTSTALDQIGEDAFIGCLSLKEICDFTEHLEFELQSTGNGYIAYYAMVIHVGVNPTVFGVDITNVGKCFFLNIDEITYLIKYEGSAESITFPESFVHSSITYYEYVVAPSAFLLNEVKQITLTSGNTGFQPGAFNNCGLLEKIIIGPTFVSTIDNRAFVGCPALMTMVVDDDNPKYQMIDNSLCNKDESNYTLYMHLQARDSETRSYDLPLVIKTVADYAFYGCANLDTIVFGNNVTTIGNNAFQNCISLQSIDLVPSVTSVGTDAYLGCVSVTRIYWPISVDATPARECIGLTELNLIGNGSAYYEYTAETVKTTPWYLAEGNVSVSCSDSITLIDGYMFANCLMVKSFVLPAGLNGVGVNVFIGCDNLTSMKIPVTIDSTSLSTCTHLVNVAIIGGTNGEKVDYTNSNYVNTPWHLSSGNSGFTLSIDEGVDYLGAYIFYGLTGVTAYAIPSTVEKISTSAFETSKIVTITFADNSELKEISSYAFRNCAELGARVTLPYGLQKIGDQVFMGCNSLTYLSCPETLYDLGDEILYSCSVIKEIEIPINLCLTKLTDSTKLQRIDFVKGTDSEGNPVTVGYDYTDETYILTPWYRCDTGNIYINIDKDSGITGVGNKTFKNTVALNSIIIPDSVESLGIEVFSGCVNMTMVTINTTSNLHTIGARAFEGCIGLETISLPDSVVTVGAEAFKGCINITVLSMPISINGSLFADAAEISELTLTHGPESVQGAGYDYTSDPASESYFGNLPWCKYNNVFDLRMSEGITYVGDYMFSGCAYMRSFELATTLTSIGDYTFYGCTSINGELSLPNGLTDIGNHTFDSCTGLSTVTLPESVQTLGINTFEQCFNITEISLPVYLDATAFTGCSSIVKVTLTAGAGEYKGVGHEYDSDKIANLPWYMGNSLTLIIGEDVTEIGSYTFCNSAVESLSIPAGIWQLCPYSFSNCASLKEITFADSESDLILGEYSFSSTGIETVSIPDRTTKISAYTFAYCTNLASIAFGTDTHLAAIEAGAFRGTAIRSIVIPKTITSLEEYVLADCSNLNDVSFQTGSVIETIKTNALANSSVRSFIIYDTTTTVGKGAFDGCNVLSTLSVPVTIDMTALGNVTSLMEITFTPGLNGVAYNYNTTEYGQLPWYGSKISNVLIKFNAGIYSIGENMFRDSCSVRNIEYYVNAQGVSDIKSIGANAFSGCTELNDFIFRNGIITIGDDAFRNCSSLHSVALPTSVKTIGANAFYGCTGLNSIDIIGESEYYTTSNGVLFSKDGKTLIQYPCAKSEDYVVPEKVTAISDHAFAYASLTSVDLSYVTSIGNYAFEHCSKLTSLYIPISVRSIGERAFDGAYKVTSLELSDDDIIIGILAFTLGTDKNKVETKVMSPDGRNLDAYTDTNTVFIYESVPCIVIFSSMTSEVVQKYHIGETIHAPESPGDYTDPMGYYQYRFSSWDGYREGMKATTDMTFNALYDAVLIKYALPSGKTLAIAPQDSLSVTISSSVVESLIKDVSSGKITSVLVQFETGSITMGASTISSLEVKDTVILIKENQNSDLPESIAKLVNGRPVYTVSIGDMHQLNGTVKVTMRYTPKAGEDIYKLKVWNVVDNGTYTEIPSTYAGNEIEFDIDHMSYFAVMYGSVTPDDPEPQPPGKDQFPILPIAIAAAAILLVAAIVVLYLKRR